MRDAVRRALREWDARARYLRRLRHIEATCSSSLQKMCTIVAFGVWAKHAKEVRLYSFRRTRPSQALNPRFGKDDSGVDIRGYKPLNPRPCLSQVRRGWI